MMGEVVKILLSGVYKIKTNFKVACPWRKLPETYWV